MISAEIKRFLTTKPFRPFAICLADGQRLPVRHPEVAFVSPGGRIVYVFAENMDSPDTIDTLLITALKPLSAKNGNGKH